MGQLFVAFSEYLNFKGRKEFCHDARIERYRLVEYQGLNVFKG